MNLDTESFNIDLLHLLLFVAVIILSVAFVRSRAAGKKTSPKAAESHSAKNSAKPAGQMAETALNAQVPEVNTSAQAPVIESANVDSAQQLLSILQQEARFIDFTQEDLTGFSDAEIGAVARVVHEGSKKALAHYLTLAPIASQAEDSSITVPAGFNPAQYRLTGNITGEAPFNGTLIHKGWQVVRCELPKIAKGHDTAILAPAEVEL